MCGCYPVEVMEDVSRVSRSEARWWDADDSHAVRDLHLFLHSWQIVRLALPSGSSWHVTKLHRAMIQPLKHKGTNTGRSPDMNSAIFRFPELMINKWDVNLWRNVLIDFFYLEPNRYWTLGIMPIQLLGHKKPGDRSAASACLLCWQPHRLWSEQECKCCSKWMPTTRGQKTHSILHLTLYIFWRSVVLLLCVFVQVCFTKE